MITTFIYNVNQTFAIDFFPSTWKTMSPYALVLLTSSLPYLGPTALLQDEKCCQYCSFLREYLRVLLSCSHNNTCKFYVLKYKLYLSICVYCNTKKKLDFSKKLY